MLRRRVVTIATLLLLSAAVTGLVLRRQGAAPAVTYRTTEATRQDIRQTVSATGIVQPLTTVDIKSRAGGEVKVLAVDVGSVVKPGDLIARIDPTDSQTTFNQAQADVSAARARVAQTQQTLSLQRDTTGTTIADAEAQVHAAEARLIQAQKQAAAQPQLTETAILQARAGLETAEQTLAQLKVSGDPQARAEARSGLLSAEANLKNAEDSLRRQQQLFAKGFVAEAVVDSARTARDVAAAQAEATRTRSGNIEANQKAELAAAQSRVNEATASLAAAEAQRVQIDLRRQDVASARASLAQARASYQASLANRQQIGIRAADIETARAQIARSEAALQNAQVQLSSTTIQAPRAGVILQKYVEQGTIITSGQSLNSPGTSIVQIGDLSHVFVDASVDEADIAQVRVGQPVKVTLDAYPDEEFHGRVQRIDPRGLTDQNVTVIHTRIEITRPDPRLKPGLNAECEFSVAERRDALAVPSRAVHDQHGQKTLQVLVAGKPETRTVTTGLEAGDTVEIVSGLEEGDQVITQIMESGGDGKNGNSGGGPRGGNAAKGNANGGGLGGFGGGGFGGR